MMNRLFATGVIVALAATATNTARAQNRRAALPARSAPPSQLSQHGRSTCDVCHSEIEFLRQNTDSMARARAVNVSDATIARSAHATLSCPSCHTGFRTFPHRGAGETRACASCHETERQAWTQGVHKSVEGQGGAACTQCHGVHDVRAADVMKTRAGMVGMNSNCVSCHQPEKLSPASPHADKVLCSGCHGAHDTQPAQNRDSRLWANQQLQTCGTCHSKVAATWVNNDIHATALLTRRAQDGNRVQRRPPACTDCHGAHGMLVTADSTLEAAASDRCAECHSRVAGPYEDTYHGQASHLGSRKAAACADCHTAHSIRRAADPRSTVASANLTKTCARCHTRVTASFTKFDPHINPHERSNPLIYWSYKFMNLLLFGTMTFFGLHTVLWLVRLSLDARKAARGGER